MSRTIMMKEEATSKRETDSIFSKTLTKGVQGGIDEDDGDDKPLGPHREVHVSIESTLEVDTGGKFDEVRELEGKVSPKRKPDDTLMESVEEAVVRVREGLSLVKTVENEMPNKWGGGGGERERDQYQSSLPYREKRQLVQLVRENCCSCWR
uniref:Uncharacterized protein n=1 Tax=Palpitomonas bilix TaxID=652834 RepID=A0A7S3CWC8_9EUKA|mmetsp:Transcript_11761/g.31656  ORF Transcript_11761/g.31656 Transcript_11761/m.31656 type:complete len:152 (+) Transcript_11761:847-1302(+)